MTVSYTPPFNLQNGTTADATQVMANFNAVTTSLANAASSGVNSDITALTALTIPITPAQGGTSTFIGGTSTGSANAQAVATVIPTGFALVSGYRVLFLGGFANTGPATLNVASSGALDIKIQTPSGDQPLVGGEILSGQWNEAVYHAADSTWHLLGVSTQLGGIGPVTTIASAATTDLALAVNHNASITGVVTITSFGSNANVNFPLYRILFTGATVLTYNATSMILPGAANITTTANDNCVALYLGSGNWQIISYTRASGQSAVPSQPPPASFSNLSIKVATNTTVAVAANQVVMWNASNAPLTAALSATIDLGTAGAVNKLDTGTIAIDSWYYIWAISDGATVGGLASLSSTAPTMPAGYTFKARIGAVQTIHGSATLYGTWQFGRRAQYVVGLAQTAGLPLMISGSSGSIAVPTWTAQAVGRFVPPTASSINLALSVNGNNSGAMVAPNSSYGAATATTNFPPIAFVNGVATAIQFTSHSSFILESTNIYYASSSASAGVECSGWEDNL